MQYRIKAKRGTMTSQTNDPVSVAFGVDPVIFNGGDENLSLAA